MSLLHRTIKSIEIVRYVPEFKVYEIKIHWVNDGCDVVETVSFISEMLFYPVTLMKQVQTAANVESSQKALSRSKIQVSLKETVVEMSRDNSVNAQTCVEKSNHLREDSLKKKSHEAIKTSETAVNEASSLLDYDALLKDSFIKNLLINRNINILKSTIKSSAPKKKRKV